MVSTVKGRPKGGFKGYGGDDWYNTCRVLTNIDKPSPVKKKHLVGVMADCEIFLPHELTLSPSVSPGVFLNRKIVCVSQLF